MDEIKDADPVCGGIEHGASSEKQPYSADREAEENAHDSKDSPVSLLPVDVNEEPQQNLRELVEEIHEGDMPSVTDDEKYPPAFERESSIAEIAESFPCVENIHEAIGSEDSMNETNTADVQNDGDEKQSEHSRPAKDCLEEVMDTHLEEMSNEEQPMNTSDLQRCEETLDEGSPVDDSFDTQGENENPDQLEEGSQNSLSIDRVLCEEHFREETEESMEYKLEEPVEEAADEPRNENAMHPDEESTELKSLEVTVEFKEEPLEEHCMELPEESSEISQGTIEESAVEIIVNPEEELTDVAAMEPSEKPIETTAEKSNEEPTMEQSEGPSEELTHEETIEPVEEACENTIMEPIEETVGEMPKEEPTDDFIKMEEEFNVTEELHFTKQGIPTIELQHADQFEFISLDVASKSFLEVHDTQGQYLEQEMNYIENAAEVIKTKDAQEAEDDFASRTLQDEPTNVPEVEVIAEDYVIEESSSVAETFLAEDIVNMERSSPAEESSTTAYITLNESTRNEIPELIIDSEKFQENGYFMENTDHEDVAHIMGNGDAVAEESFEAQPEELMDMQGNGDACDLVVSEFLAHKVYSHAQEITSDDNLSSQSLQELAENVTESAQTSDIQPAEDLQTISLKVESVLEPEGKDDIPQLIQQEIEAAVESTAGVIFEQPAIQYNERQSTTVEEPEISVPDSMQALSPIPPKVEEELDFETRYALFVGKVLPGHEVFYLPQQSIKKTTKQISFPKGGTLDRHPQTLVTSSPIWEPSANNMRAKSATLGAPRRPHRSHRPQPRPAVNDDHLFPDSVTPSKVEKTLSQDGKRGSKNVESDLGYDVPFMDDDAFVPKKYRSGSRREEVDVEDDSCCSSSVSDYSMETRDLLGTDHLAKLDEVSSHIGRFFQIDLNQINLMK